MLFRPVFIEERTGKWRKRAYDDARGSDGEPLDANDTSGAGAGLMSRIVQCSRGREAKSLLRKMTPIARRVLGDTHELTFKMRAVYAQTFYIDDSATLDDLHEAVENFEELERTARRVFGATQPTAMSMLRGLGESRRVLRAREGTA